MDKKKTWFAQQKEVLEGQIKGISVRNRVIIFLVTLALIGGGFWYFLYEPNQQKILRQQREIEEAQKRLDQLVKASLMVGQIQKELATIEEQLKELLVFLPDIREIPSVLESISALGSKAGLKQLILFEPKGEELREFHMAIPIQLELVGSFHNLGIFYDEVAQLKRVVKVRSFDMKRKGDGDVGVNCTVETYRYIETPPQQPQGKGAPAKGKK